jgi:hypothetical protein
MKTLGTAQDKQSLLERVAKVRSDSPRAWGKMSAPQMISHLNDCFRMVSGEKQASSMENFFSRTIIKWFALLLPISWPHGLPTIPELDQQSGGTTPAEFETDKTKLIALTEQFGGKPAFLATARHPFFGKMSIEEWMRWAYLHMDHHLRQFNC